MCAFAFCSSFTLRPSLRPPPTLPPLHSPVSPFYYPSRRVRARVYAKEKLYPDPDDFSPSSSPDDSEPDPPLDTRGRRFFDKLNIRHSRRDPVVDTTASAVNDPATSSAQPSTPRYKSAVILDPAGAGTGEEEEEDGGGVQYKKASNALWRLGWATWWVQLILTVIAGIILLFSFAFPGVNIRSSASLLGFVLSSLGILFAFISLFWTYSYTRLSLWLVGSLKRTPSTARSRIGGKLRVGLALAIVGLAVSLTGMQAIVGTLLARLLGAGIATTPYTAFQMTPGGTGLPPGAGVVQPVDVLVVQACANAMTALLVALTSTVWLRARSKKWL